MTQYDLDVIVQKIQDKSPFEYKDNKRGKERTLKIVIVRLYESLDYENKPRACREKVTQLLLFHGQFSKEEINTIFEDAVRRTTSYSKEFLEQYPELTQLSESSIEKMKKNGEEILEEITYRFPSYI